jgi:ribosomal protein L37E
LIDLVNIAKSWIIARNPNEEQKDKAESRITICNKCPHSGKVLGAEVCTLCGCPLSKKIFSPNGPGECPDGRWVI